MKFKKITIKKINQNYLINLITKNNKISSGRKNYKQHYERILKNVLLSKLFAKKIIPFKGVLKIKNNQDKMSLKYKYK